MRRMNEIKKFLLPAAAMFIFSGCTEEFLSDTEVMGNTTIVGRMAEKSQTRTCIGSDGTSDVSIYWSPADSIWCIWRKIQECTVRKP